MTGVNVFNQGTGEFEFRPGPVFANVLLVDEINRASPKTQSALLEAMQETQVTIDGATYPLDLPFFVVATQNPIEYEGTYPLPGGAARPLHRAPVPRVPAVRRGGAACSPSRRPLRRSTSSRRSPTATTSSARSQAARAVYVEESVGEYVVTILRHTRDSSLLALGASPRAGIALLRMSKARAVALGRDYVIPEDVQAVAGVVLAHRVILAPEARASGMRGEDAVERALAEAPIPK